MRPNRSVGDRPGKAPINPARRRVAVLACLVMMTAGCGTRSEHRGAPSGAASQPTASAADPTALPAPATPGSVAAPQGGRAPAPGPSAPITGDVPGSASSSRTVAPVPGPQPKAPTVSGAQPATGRPPAAGPPGGAPAAPAPGAGGGLPGPSGPRSVVRLGNVGTYSGPAGETFLAYLHGSQIWVKYVNAVGGLNGHPVELSVADDGGDPARHRSLVQDMVERRKVLAFLNNVEVLTGAGSIEYINSKRIPVIGGTGGEKWAYDTPMYFPQTPSAAALVQTLYGGIASQAVAKGKKKLAVVACAEVALCSDIRKAAKDEAARWGMELVYEGQASLAQPDFTAECLSARNAGADVFFPIADAAFVGRVAASCARQSYRPLIGSGGQALLHRLKDDPNLNNNFVAGISVFPYFEDNTPLSAQYQAAFKQYGQNIQPGGGVSIGWVAGKLMEKAAAQLPEPPTTDALLRGLWSIHNDDLGGLTQPLTFTEGKPATPVACWWNVAIANNTWISPDNFTRICR